MRPIHVELNLFPVLGFPGMYATRGGRIFILRKDRFYEPKVYFDNSERESPSVNYRREDGTLTHVTVKRAMANAFIGKEAVGQMVRFRDGDDRNVTAENIFIDPRKSKES